MSHFHYQVLDNPFSQQYENKVEDFYISYDPSSDTTALVIHAQFSWVLKGNHLDDFLLQHSFSECMKLIHERKQLLNSGSYSLPPLNLTITEITDFLSQVSCESGLLVYGYKGWSVKRNDTRVFKGEKVKISPTPIQLADQLVAFIEGW